MPSKQAGQPGSGKPRGRPLGRKQRTVQPPNWRDRLKLDPGDTVRQSRSMSTGNLGQDDVEHHEVVDAQDQVIGTVVFTASTSLKPPFRTSHWLVQKDIDGVVIVEERW